MQKFFTTNETSKRHLPAGVGSVARGGLRNGGGGVKHVKTTQDKT